MLTVADFSQDTPATPSQWFSKHWYNYDETATLLSFFIPPRITLTRPPSYAVVSSPPVSRCASVHTYHQTHRSPRIWARSQPCLKAYALSRCARTADWFKWGNPPWKTPLAMSRYLSTYGEPQAVQSSSPKTYFPSEIKRHRTGYDSY